MSDRWSHEFFAQRLADNPSIKLARESPRTVPKPQTATTVRPEPESPQPAPKATKPAIRQLAARMSEAELQANVRELARVRGWKGFHAYDSRRSDVGFPDLVLVRKNRLLFVELKSEKGKPTPEQIEWLHVLMLTRRVETYVWKPSQWLSGEIEAMLR